MCPQYRQRQTSELNEQGKNDIPVRCQGACAKSRRFLEILQNILISKLSLFYMHFSCQNTGIYSLKKPVNPRKLKVSSTAGRPSQHTLRCLNCSLFTSSVCGNMSSASSVCGNLSIVTASALHQQTRICHPNCFLISAFTLSKSLQVKIGISRLISSMLLSHHLNLSSNSISSSSKRF